MESPEPTENHQPVQRSKSRSRSRSRSRKTRAATRSPRKPAGGSDGETLRKSKSVSPSRRSRSTVLAPETPTRISRRLQEKAEQQIEEEMNRAKSATGGGDARQNGVKHVTSTVKAEHNHGEAIAFGGSIGGAVLTLVLPITVFFLTLAMDKKNGASVTKIPGCPGSWKAFFDVEVFGIVFGWYVFQAALALIPLGPTAKGQPLAGHKGQRLDYRCNGFLALLITTVLFAGAFHMDCVKMDYIYNHWLQFVTASIVLSLILSVYLYMRALFCSKADLAPEVTDGLFNDFFMGRELNPRIFNGALDLKFFFELRPGLIGWMLVDWSLAASQYKELGAVSPALAIVTLFQTVYVFDALKNESAILTTMDITTEGFGFMLAFGDLAWVPALYGLQAHFLYTYPEQAVTNSYALLAICALETLGLYIFRGANSTKDKFRANPNDPSVAHLETIPTSTGKKLLCSGFWGISRRPNYLGDLLMALAWCLPCGFSCLLPYFYPISFFILLAHRQVRDEAYCRQRYGKAWDKYCEKVPYRIIPYVF